MFYCMVGICKITQWDQCSIRWQQAGHVEIFDQNYQPSKVTLQVSVLMVKYLVAMSFQLLVV